MWLVKWKLLVGLFHQIHIDEKVSTNLSFNRCKLIAIISQSHFITIDTVDHGVTSVEKRELRNVDRVPQKVSFRRLSLTILFPQQQFHQPNEQRQQKQFYKESARFHAVANTNRSADDFTAEGQSEPCCMESKSMDQVNLKL